MYSSGYPTHSEEEDEDVATEDKDVDTSEEDIAQPNLKQEKGKVAATDDMKKPVFVDAKGFPYGSKQKVLHKDVQLLAKEFDPRHNWEGQSREAKEQFFERVYAGMASMFVASTISEHPRCQQRCHQRCLRKCHHGCHQRCHYRCQQTCHHGCHHRCLSWMSGSEIIIMHHFVPQCDEEFGVQQKPLQAF